MTPELIQKVKKINRQAALFMVKKVPLLVKRGKLTSISIYEKELKQLPMSDKLISTFTFSKTPQKFKYWEKIAIKLGEW